MMTKQRILLIIIIIIAAILLVVLNLPRISSDEKNAEIYSQALSDYENADFENAYYLFSKVSKQSKLKPAALFRQAKCADQLNDDKSALKNYKKLTTYYPNSGLAVKAKYLAAQSMFNINEKKSKRSFEKIVRLYPDSEYAIAAQYYLGTIEAGKLSKTTNKKKTAQIQKKSSEHFRAYLKNAPSGRFAIQSVQNWEATGTKLTNEDNLLIAKSYLSLGNYKKAQQYLNYTTINDSWPVMVENSYYLKNYSKVKYYTETGLKNYSAFIPEKDIYDAIDTYLKVEKSSVAATSYLMSFSQNSRGYDYLYYMNCKSLPIGSRAACFNTLYYKFPNGQFSADSLANIFYAQIKSQNYYRAKQLGREHLRRFMDTNSAPRVMFWMGKVAERTKNYEEATSYYRSLMNKFPDDYYAYKAYLRTKRIIDPIIQEDINIEPVVFPYKKAHDGDLVIKLAQLEDYGLINELCKNDKFVQSWLAYEKGEYSHSAVLARDAMDELKVKPAKDDLRWRLVYPVHYYDEIKKNAHSVGNNPIMILSIIREESYFNPDAKSPVGASGLMQLMPTTANEVRTKFGLTPKSENYLFDPEMNIRFGNVYYSQLKKALNDKDLFAVLAYNGGIGSVTRWKQFLDYDDADDFAEQIPYSETQNYLKKVFRSYWNYSRIYN